MKAVTFPGRLLFLNILLLSLCGAAYAQRQANEVLLVYNAGSPVSTAVAKYYKSKRHITNVVGVKCIDSALSSDNETIDFSDYSTQIAKPISR